MKTILKSSICAVLAAIFLIATTTIVRGDETGDIASSTISDVQSFDSVLGSQNDLSPIHASITYPSLFTGAKQSALKSGDIFGVSINTNDLFVHDVTADLQELGLSSATPMSGTLGRFDNSSLLVLPNNIPDGTKTVTVHAKNAFDSDVSEVLEVQIDNLLPHGTMQATFTKEDGIAGAWTAHISGTYSGTGSGAVAWNPYIYGVADSGTKLDITSVTLPQGTQIPSTFSWIFLFPILVQLGQTLPLRCTCLMVRGTPQACTVIHFQYFNLIQFLSITHSAGR